MYVFSSSPPLLSRNPKHGQGLGPNSCDTRTLGRRDRLPRSKPAKPLQGRSPLPPRPPKLFGRVEQDREQGSIPRLVLLHPSPLGCPEGQELCGRLWVLRQAPQLYVLVGEGAGREGKGRYSSLWEAGS